MPLKYCLWRLGLIRSPECRLPLTTVSTGLATTLDEFVAAAPNAKGEAPWSLLL